MGLNLRNRRSIGRHSVGRNDEGYILLTLILMVSLLIIAAAAIVPTITFEIRRDREEEMIHRGVQYSRAIRTYYKKFNRYPAKLEDLESTNNLRFLRKRYKDPITGQDFKLLHFGEVKMTMGAPLAGATNLNVTNLNASNLNAALNGASSLNGNSVFGQSQPGGSFGGGAGFGGAGKPEASPEASASDASNKTDQNQGDPASASSSTTGQQPGLPGATSSGGLSGQTFGGMPVVGVVSTSKKEGIREFNHKRKYSEWQFIYDPATDRGGLLMTPNQPPIQGFANQPLQPGQQGNTTSSPFGQSPGPQSNPSLNGPGMNGTPNPPPTSNPPEQQ